MKISDKVESILKNSHAARNSDKELLILYMQQFGLELGSKQVDLFRKMPSVETIRRTRQVLQEHGKYPADEKVEEERYKKYVQVRHGILDESPEKLLESQGYKVREWGE